MIGVGACDWVFECLAVVHCHVVHSSDNRQNCWICCPSVRGDDRAVHRTHPTEDVRCHLHSAAVANEVTVHLHELLRFRVDAETCHGPLDTALGLTTSSLVLPHAKSDLVQL